MKIKVKVASSSASRPMKESDIDWLGRIPITWNVARLKDIKSPDTYAIVDGPFGTAISTSDYLDHGVPLTRIINLNGQTLSTDNMVYLSSEHAEKVKRSRFYEGDIIFAKTGATVGKCALNSNVEEGILSSSCIKIQISPENCNRYYYYFFSTNQFNEALRMSCNGTTRDTINLKPFSCLSCVVPPIEEQVLIADYLDKECARIDSVIEKTHESIEKYKKLKQSIITEAVTKGVRPNRELKDTCISWIGEIPVEWDVVISRFVFDQIADVDHYMPESVEDGIPYVMTGDLCQKISLIDFDSCKKIPIEDYKSLRKKVKLAIGDVIFARYATIGTVCYVDMDMDCVISYSCVTIKPTRAKLLGKYLYYYLQSAALIEDVSQFVNSNTQGNVGIDALYRIKIPIPPLTEQSEISDYLDNILVKLESLIQEKQLLLLELNKYKKTIVFEYVTGKKEVTN